MQVQLKESVAEHREASTLPSYLEAESFSKISHYALLSYTVFAGLSIWASKVILVSLILYWLVREIRIGKFAALRGSEIVEKFAAPIFALVLASLASTILGVDFLRAAPELVKTSFYLLFPFVVYSSLTEVTLSREEFFSRIHAYLLTLLCSQAIAALNTIFSEAAGYRLPPSLPGTVTESGQLVLVIPAAIALVLCYLLNKPIFNLPPIRVLGGYLSLPIYSCGLLLAILVYAWPNVLLPKADISALRIAQISAGCISLLAIVLALRSPVRNGYSTKHSVATPFADSSKQRLIWICATLVVAALLLNLKRGPWLGLSVVVLATGLALSRKVLIGAFLFGVFLIFLLAPARSRVLNSATTFR